MNTPSEETAEDGNQRKKSIGLASSKTRRYSVGVPTSRKSIAEEGNIVPNYLRASTGSCHDFCKYGKHHEQSKTAVSVKFKTTATVNKDKFTKVVVPLEKKKTTPKPSSSPEPAKLTKKVTLLPSTKPQILKRSSSTNGNAAKNEVKTIRRSTSLVKTRPVVVKRDASSQGSNVGIKKVEEITVKKTGITPKTSIVKKVAPKPSLNESQPPKASFNRTTSLKGTKYIGGKQVNPLKDKNRMQKTKPKQTTDEVEPEFDPEVEPEVKPETMEFDFIQSSTESINDTIRNSSESFMGKKIIGESVITHPVYESSEVFSDKDLLEESLVSPAVVESSHSCSDKEVFEQESLISPPVSESSESFYDDEVVEGESEYTDDEEAEVSEGSETADVIETQTAVGNDNKIPRKGRMVISEDKDEKAVKLRFRRGKILDIQSESNGPRRLKFRRRVTEGNEDGQSIARRTYKNKTLEVQTEVNKEKKQHVFRRSFEKKNVEEEKDAINGPESVVLKHQGEQEKKDTQGLFNNVIEETASKLVESRKSKVKALVGAFESVISLQDGKPSST